MILNRIGNKKRIAEKIESYFPSHSYYIEPFFGAGGMFFSKKFKDTKNSLNDIDNDVFNLYQVVMNDRKKLLKEFMVMPASQSLFKYWLKNEETEPIKKALRFLMLSNLSLYGKGDVFNLDVNVKIHTIKKNFEENLNNTFEFLKYSQFANLDFRKFLKSLSFKDERERKNSLIYCDPPYPKTNSNYSHDFLEKDFTDLIESLNDTRCKFVVSCYDTAFTKKVVKDFKLNSVIIREVQSIKKRETEIILLNYKPEKEN